MIEEVKESCVLQVHHKQDHIMVGEVVSCIMKYYDIKGRVL